MKQWHSDAMLDLKDYCVLYQVFWGETAVWQEKALLLPQVVIMTELCKSVDYGTPWCTEQHVELRNGGI